MPPKQFELIEQRTISGRGLFVVPPNDAYRHFYLYINVIRFPRNNWLNSKWNPDRSEYAKITWMRNDYVFREDVVNYPNQLFEHSPDPGSGGYIVQGMVCLFEEVSNYFDYIIPFIPAPPLVPGGAIPIEPLRNTPEQIKIVCRESTAIVAKLYALEYEEACASATSTPKPPPDPEPEPEQPVPSPIGDVSPPYEEPNDDGDTIPYPGDESTPPPPTPGFWVITVTVASGDPVAFDPIEGVSTDVFTVVTPSPACPQSGSSDLIRNGTEPVFRPLNCNAAGFVSEIVSAVFTPGT